MGRRNDVRILDVLMLFPWWVSVLISAVVYVFLALIAPNIVLKNQMLHMMLQALSGIAHFIAFFLLVPAPLSYLKQREKSKRLDAQKGIETIRALSWRQFEELVGEAYRRKGYTVIENESAGADGGIDLRLRKDGAIHLVQCKQWRSQKVGVSIVREMFGVLTSEKAASMSIITSGMFTQKAKNFAQGKAIDLVDGTQLQQMVSQVQSSQAPITVKTKQKVKSQLQSQQACPKCGSELVLRTANKGANAGNQFIGCSAFPKCRHTEPVNG